MSNIPQWDTAPEWAQWLAQDQTGLWAWFEELPRMGETKWLGGTRAEYAGLSSVRWDWRNSLRKRPPEVPEGLPKPAICSNQGCSLPTLGDDSLCYECVEAMVVKQPRYQDHRGEDWIDEFARTAIEDYCRRWRQYEESIK